MCIVRAVQVPQPLEFSFGPGVTLCTVFRMSCPMSCMWSVLFCAAVLRCVYRGHCRVTPASAFPLPRRIASLGMGKQQGYAFFGGGSSVRLGTANAQTAPAATSTALEHQRRGSANAETTPAGAPAAAADRTQRPMRREERVTVQGPVKKQPPDGMSHGGGGGFDCTVCVVDASKGLTPPARALNLGGGSKRIGHGGGGPFVSPFQTSHLQRTHHNSTTLRRRHPA